MSINANVKSFIETAKKKVQEKNFKQALSEIEPALMLSKKNREANLIGGYCYKELGLYEQALDCYLIAQDQKPDDPTVLKLLYELYLITDKPQAKEYLLKLMDVWQKQDKQDKVSEYLVKTYEIDLELKNYANVDDQFKQIMNNDYVKNELKCKISLVHLQLQIKLANRISKETLKFISQKLKDLQGKELEELVEFIVQFYEQKYEQNKIKASYLIVFELFNSIKIVKTMIQNIYLFIQEKSILHKLTIQLTDYFQYINEKQQNLQKKWDDFEEFFKDEAYDFKILARIFLLFIFRYLKKEIRLNQQEENQLEKIYLQLSTQEDEEMPEGYENYILTYPVCIQKMDSEQAVRQIKLFNEQIQILSENTLNMSKLEEISSRLSMNFITNPEHLTQTKNLLKLRIKQKNYDVKTLIQFYELQMKLARMTGSFDEELDIYQILDEIILKEPSAKFISEKCQWMLSNDLQDLSAIKKNLEDSLQYGDFQSNIFKRLGIILWRQNNMVEAQNYFNKALELDSQDYQIYVNLAVLKYLQTQDPQPLLQKAFLLNHFDIQLNKMIYLSLAKKNIRQAVQFLESIYQAFQNSLWINYTLGLYYSNEGDFENSEKYFIKSIQIFSCKLDKQEKLNIELVGFKYIINQNKKYYLDDSLIFGDKIYEKEGEILTENYFQKDSNSIQLWIQMSEINKNLGKISSASKCIQECEAILLKQKQIKTQDKNQYYLQLLQLFENCFLNNRKQSQTIIYENFQTEQILIYIQNAYMDLFMKRHYQCFQQIYKALQTLVYFPINSEILKLILESGLDYIQKCLVTQSPGVALSMMYNLQKMIELKNFQRSQKELSEFWQLYGKIQSKPEYIQKSIEYQKQALLYEFGIDDSFPIPKVQNDILSSLLCNLILNYLLLDQFQPNQSDEHQAQKICFYSLQLFPENERLYNYLAYLNIDFQIGALLKIIQLDKRNCIAVEQLGLIYFKNKQYHASLKLFMKSMELNNKSPRAYQGIVLICLIYIFEIQKRIEQHKIKNKNKNLGQLMETQNKFLQKACSYIGFSNLYQQTDTSLIQEQLINKLFNIQSDFFSSENLALQYLDNEFWIQFLQKQEEVKINEEQLKDEITNETEKINNIWINPSSTILEIISPLKVLLKKIDILILIISKKQINNEKKYIYQINKIITDIKIDFTAIDKNQFMINQMKIVYKGLSQSYLNLLQISQSLTKQFLNQFVDDQNWPFYFLSGNIIPCKYPGKLHFYLSFDYIRRNQITDALNSIKLSLFYDPSNNNYQKIFAEFRSRNNILIQKGEIKQNQSFRTQAVYNIFSLPDQNLNFIKELEQNGQFINKGIYKFLELKNFFINKKIIENPKASDLVIKRAKILQDENQNNLRHKKKQLYEKILQGLPCQKSFHETVTQLSDDKKEKFYVTVLQVMYIIQILYEKGFGDSKFYFLLEKMKKLCVQEKNIVQLNIIQYFILAQENFQKDFTFDNQVQILQYLKDRADDVKLIQKCLDYANKNINMYFIYLHYCSILQKVDELESTLQTFSLYKNHLTPDQEYLFNYFLLILHYQIITENPQEQESVISFFDIFNYLKTDASSSLSSVLYYLKGVLGLHMDDASQSRMKLSLPFKLACLYTPQMAENIIDNLVDSGFDKVDPEQEEKIRQQQIEQAIQQDYYYQQQFQDEAELIMDQMYQQYK